MAKSKKKMGKKMITHQKEEIVEKRNPDNNGYFIIESFLDALLLEFNRLK